MIFTPTDLCKEGGFPPFRRFQIRLDWLILTAESTPIFFYSCMMSDKDVLVNFRFSKQYDLEPELDFYNTEI